MSSSDPNVDLIGRSFPTEDAGRVTVVASWIDTRYVVCENEDERTVIRPAAVVRRSLHLIREEA